MTIKLVPDCSVVKASYSLGRSRATCWQTGSNSKLSHKHIQRAERLKLMTNDVNPAHGPQRLPRGCSQTVVSPQAGDGWTRPTVAGYAHGAERCLLGLAHRRSLARSAASLSSPRTALRCAAGRSTQTHSKQTRNTRQPRTAPLPSPLENRAIVRMAS